MAFASLFALLDDIATVLDDVSVMTKVAAKKTAGVLGDDLALNAQQVAGAKANRELPIVWQVAKGSFINKLILVPIALLLSAFIPALITPLLMIGGAYLCFEGAEKIVHTFFHKSQAEDEGESEEPQAFDEKTKIRGAIRTDFILSAEIVIIALGTVSDMSLAIKATVLSIIAIAMTVGVYGLVAGIVKIDDVGFWLLKKPSALAKKVGQFLVGFTPYLMKFLSIAGTVAMFLVGGSIILHGLPMLEHTVAVWFQEFNSIASMLLTLLWHAVVGLVIGLVVLLVVSVIQRLFFARKQPAH